MAFIQPLDLETIFVGNLAGTFIIFIFLALVVITVLGARMRMPNIVIGGMLLVFIFLVGATSIYAEGSELRGLILIAGIVISIMLGRTIVKIMQR